MRFLVIVALASCGPRVHHDPIADPDDDPADPVLIPDARAPVVDPPALEAGPPPAACGERAWRACSVDMILLLEGSAAEAERAMQVFRASCEEGDRRGCFEREQTTTTRAACREDWHPDACHQLALLYDKGRATCAPDLACAATLEEMACIGGVRDACR